MKVEFNSTTNYTKIQLSNSILILTSAKTPKRTFHKKKLFQKIIVPQLKSEIAQYEMRLREISQKYQQWFSAVGEVRQ